MDIINQLSLGTNTDDIHRIWYSCGDKINSLSLSELDRCAWSVARHLRKLGFHKGSMIGICATNCLEWVILDLAILKLGGITAGLDAGRFDALAALRKFELSALFIEGSGMSEAGIFGLGDVMGWANDPAPGERETVFHQRYEPEQPFAVKFTSGSTGPPKGMEALAGGVNDSLTEVQAMFNHCNDDNILVFLRLSQLQQRYWCYSALAFGHDVTITTLGDVFTVAQAVRPTIVMGVPGFFDDVKGMLEKPDSSSRSRPEGAVQALFGGRLRYLWTGSAPARRATLDFFETQGVPLYQGYGLNETCIVSKNCPGANRYGSVGRVLPSKTVRFDERGVLVVGSRNPFVRRYRWCSPGDNEKMFLPGSGEVITQDLAKLDADGYLYIIGRVDEVVVLTTGRNVLLPPIEEMIGKHPDIHMNVIYGHGKPFLTAVISPKTPPLDRKQMELYLDEINHKLFPEQQIRGLVISPERFTAENELLTTQFKVRRPLIFQRFHDELEAIYNAPENEGSWKGQYGV